ncbi:MAG: 30S ribosomal protein S6 [Bythopirellula sp.]|nr:30S ribosomal protein S6 [Bythopirellula sp.]
MDGNIGVYEGLFILDSNAFARDREGLPRDINGYIEAAGGQIEVSRLWEERRLAYPIKGQRKGAYWITYFRLPTGALKDLTRQCEIHDGILRQLFVRLPGALVEPILEHAKSGGVVRVTPVADDIVEVEEEVVAT